MNILVTAGNTQVPIDRVRCITNIFTGRTGAQIALHACERGHRVTLLTSHPEVVAELRTAALPPGRWTVRPYRTFDELHALMEETIRPGRLDAVIHCAAVSDYLAAGIYAPAPNTHFRPEDGRWDVSAPGPPAMIDRAAGKVKSDEAELWLRLVRAPKLIDRVRTDWGFRGILVKFKLEVGVKEEQLLEIAERSRRHSGADLMVANTLEEAPYRAYLGPLDGKYQHLVRRHLATRLLDEVERLHGERSPAAPQAFPEDRPVNVLLGVTGSVAAIRVPELYRQLRAAGCAVKVVATGPALYFFDPAELDPGRPGRNPEIVILDEDEWPGRSAGKRYQREDKVLHIELRRWADLLLIAPLDANTLAKLANGLSDNCLTCVWRAWDADRPVVLAPAMNTLMWEHPLTDHHLRRLAADAGHVPPASLDLSALVTWINEHCPRLWIVGPISKRLACDDVGLGAMAEVPDIVAAVTAFLRQRSAAPV